MPSTLGPLTALCTLAAVRLAAAATPPEHPPVLLNHFFVVTDKDTYAAAQASAFLTKEFAGIFPVSFVKDLSADRASTYGSGDYPDADPGVPELG